MNETISVLLIEDHHAIADQVCRFLESQGWQCDYAPNGQSGLALAQQHHYDVILLDLNLPDMDGLDICRTLKDNADVNTPILMLTARDAMSDKTKGFGEGADDYLTKPFDLREVVLRCQALARRTNLHRPNVLTIGQLCFNCRALQVTFWQEEVKCTQIGFQILLQLAQIWPDPLSRSRLQHAIWKEDIPESDALKSHMYQLRKALSNAWQEAQLKQNLAAQSQPPTFIKTLSSVGYQLQCID